MKVYRLEHPIYGTPYRAPNHEEFNSDELYELLSDMLYDHSHTATRPDASKEFPGFFSGYHYCGCSSLEKLEEWFTGWIDHLIVWGFVVVAYEVNALQVKEGKIQCIFPMVHATRLY